MMKKICLLLFVIACMALCLIPSLGMTFFATNERIGNEQETPFPALISEEDGYNSSFLPELGTYFDKHFAFRPQSIDLDAKIQSMVFSTSNLDTVTVGENGWLYYSSTLNDFLGKDPLSQREINGIAHNLSLAQEYVENKGAKFLFTVAPNKNTLYPENMPYYYRKAASDEHNRDKLKDALSAYSVNYCDLFALFEEQDEVLYLKQDSHWNNKGALMVYNAVLDSLSKAHDDYSSLQPTRVCDFYGDLSKMLYPGAQQPEYNYAYPIDEPNYVTPTKSVEEAIIRTERSDASGSLYMYRDSFGNSLLPFFANAYGSAYFTKTFPINMELDLTSNPADTVVFEIVERNLVWFLENPPAFTSPERVVNISDSVEGKAEVEGSVLMANMTLISLEGTVDSSLCQDDSVIYLQVKNSDGKSGIFEAFNRKTDENGDGFAVYLPFSAYGGQPLEVDVIVGTGDTFTKVYHTSVDKIDAEVIQ